MKTIEGGYLVTGGGSGIGEATAEMLVNRGRKVTICGRRGDKIDAVVRRLGGACHGVKADVTSPADRARLVKEAIQHGNGLRGLINNAGNMYRSRVADYDSDQLLDIFNQNVVSGMMLAQETLTALKASEGSIVFLGSIHTQRAFPGASPYAASKAALQAVTQVMAAELGPEGIRVNCVLPGAVPTDINVRAGLGSQDDQAKRMKALEPLHALGRIGSAEEVAEAIGYLLDASWTTGALLTVDGGLSLGMTHL
jgi:3-oxoacyl-[acyl-carrier protein] reductase